MFSAILSFYIWLLPVCNAKFKNTLSSLNNQGKVMFTINVGIVVYFSTFRVMLKIQTSKQTT